jgi:plastocyanin
MKSKPFPVMGFSLILVLIPMALSLMTGDVGAKDKSSKVTVCSNPHPQQLCSAANTCGSSNSPCVLEIRRTGGGDDASVTPNIPNFPKERPAICIAVGTSVTWQGEGKNTGIMVDFGGSSPFDPSGTIMGGSDRPVTVLAKAAGCYKYTVGACNPGSVYGMCGNSDFDLIVTGAK